MVFVSGETPTEAEATAIEKLRELIGVVPPAKVGPALDAPASLLRWVRGYQLDAKEAAKAFAQMLAYRADNSIDAAREEMFAASDDGASPVWPADLPRFKKLVEITGDGLMRRIGHAASGNPATLVLLHEYQLKQVIKAGLVALIIQLQQYQDEWWSVELFEQSIAAGYLLARDDIVHAGDLGLFHFDIACARAFPQVLAGSKHYPEVSARIISVGNGKALIAMYNAVIRPFMPAHTKEKIQVFGKDLNTSANVGSLALEPATLHTLLELIGCA